MEGTVADTPGGYDGPDKGRKTGRRARPSRSRPWLAVAVAETAGDVGGVVGSPRVRRGLVTGVPASAREWRIGAGASRKVSRRCAGSVTEVPRRHEERENSTLPRVFPNGHGRAVDFRALMGALKSTAPFGPLSRDRKGLRGPESVTFPISPSTTRARCGFSRAERRRSPTSPGAEGVHVLCHPVGDKGHGPPS
jgi:hypothetical protein